MDYVHQAYPKKKYRANGEVARVESQEEEDALQGDWADSPAGPFPDRGGHRRRAEEAAAAETEAETEEAEA